MKLKTLSCPNCHANLEVEDGLDTFFCKYCGHKILLQGQGLAAYAAKVQVKKMEHKERLQRQRNDQERYRTETEQKNRRRSLAIGLSILGVCFAVLFISMAAGEAGVRKQEQELQAVVDQIMIDIENENFVSAYVKANSLYWNCSYTKEGKTKWDAIRKETINQIEKAEKKATESTSK